MLDILAVDEMVFEEFGMEARGIDAVCIFHSVGDAMVISPLAIPSDIMH